LQNSEIKGQRYLNDKSRREGQRRREREEAVAELEQMHEELIARERARIEAQQRKSER
jgi:hypothetical protein